MSDATGTEAAHPALVTATGPATPPAREDDATRTDAAHPAIVTRLPAPEPRPAGPSPPATVHEPHPHRHRRHGHGLEHHRPHHPRPAS